MNCRRIVQAIVMWAMVPVLAAWGQMFSVDFASPTVTQGFGQPDDLFLGQSALPPALIPPALLIPGAGFDVDGLSLGRPLSDFGINAPSFFSVSRGSFGVAGTASAVESTAGEESSDVYLSAYNGTNTLIFDGDGLATGSNPAAPPLSVAEPATFLPQPIPPPVAVGDVDGLDMRGSWQQPPAPPPVVYFSVDPLSVTNGVYGPGTSAADIYVGTAIPPAGTYDSPAAPGLPPFSPSGPQPYATEFALGIAIPAPGGNDVDALVVFDNGDQVYQPGQDIIVFSLAPGSAYVGMTDPISGLAISEGDILIDGTSAMNLLGSPLPNAAILHTAESLGLRTIRAGFAGNDNLNALDIVVPEPGTLTALLIGCAMVLLGRRAVVS